MMTSSDSLPQLSYSSVVDGRPLKARAKLSAADLMAQINASGTRRSAAKLAPSFDASTYQPLGPFQDEGGALSVTPQATDRIDALTQGIGANRQTLAGTEDPYGGQALQNKAAGAQTLAEKVALETLGPPPTHAFQALDPGQYPRMGTLPIPDRPQAKVNPWVQAAAGLGGMIAPQSASQFQVQAIQGANDQSDQQYQDALRQRAMKLQELSQAHQNEIAAHNEALKYAESNLRGKERTDYLNALGNYDYETVLGKLGATGRGQDVLGSGYGDLTGAARQRAGLAATIQGQMETRDRLLGELNAQRAGQAEQLKLKNELDKANITANSRVTVQDKRNEGQAATKFGRDVFNPVTGQMEHQQGQFETQKYGIDQRFAAAQARTAEMKRDHDLIDARVRGSAAYKGIGGKGSNQLQNTQYQRASISDQSAQEGVRKVQVEMGKLKAAGLLADPDTAKLWTGILNEAEARAAEAHNAFKDAATNIFKPSVPGPGGSSSYSKTATNPKTGEKLGWDGAKWVPIK